MLLFGKKQNDKKKMSLPTPKKVNGNSQGGGGFKSTIFFKEKYDHAKLEFSEGLGVMRIFWNNTIQVLGIPTDDHKTLSLSCWMLHVRGHVITTYIFHICLNLGLLERSGFR